VHGRGGTGGGGGRGWRGFVETGRVRGVGSAQAQGGGRGGERGSIQGFSWGGGGGPDVSWGRPRLQNLSLGGGALGEEAGGGGGVNHRQMQRTAPPGNIEAVPVESFLKTQNTMKL